MTAISLNRLSKAQLRVTCGQAARRKVVRCGITQHCYPVLHSTAAVTRMPRREGTPAPKCIKLKMLIVAVAIARPSVIKTPFPKSICHACLFASPSLAMQYLSRRLPGAISIRSRRPLCDEAYIAPGAPGGSSRLSLDMHGADMIGRRHSRHRVAVVVGLIRRNIVPYAVCDQVRLKVCIWARGGRGLPPLLEVMPGNMLHALVVHVDLGSAGVVLVDTELFVAEPAARPFGILVVQVRLRPHHVICPFLDALPGSIQRKCLLAALVPRKLAG